jgi:3-polyprenyl-4-hydroxybenzoate decarboxylase
MAAVKYADLRDFLAQLERRGVKRISAEVDPRLG